MAIEFMLDEFRTIVLIAALKSFLQDSDNKRKFPNLVIVAETMLSELAGAREYLHSGIMPNE